VPRKRRQPKQQLPLPRGLAQISLTERARWTCAGPLLADDVDGPIDPCYHVWPDWDTWAEFYGAVRAELYGAWPHRRERSVAEQLYLAWSNGGDVDRTRKAILATRAAAEDPRRIFAR